MNRRRDAEAKLKQGHRLLMEGDLQRAVAAFTEAITIDSHYVAAHRLRSQAYRHLGQEAEAEADSQQANLLSRAASPVPPSSADRPQERCASWRAPVLTMATFACFMAACGVVLLIRKRVEAGAPTVEVCALGVVAVLALAASCGYGVVLAGRREEPQEAAAPFYFVAACANLVPGFGLGYLAVGRGEGFGRSLLAWVLPIAIALMGFCAASTCSGEMCELGGVLGMFGAGALAVGFVSAPGAIHLLVVGLKSHHGIARAGGIVGLAASVPLIWAGAVVGSRAVSGDRMWLMDSIALGLLLTALLFAASLAGTMLGTYLSQILRRSP